MIRFDRLFYNVLLSIKNIYITLSASDFDQYLYCQNAHTEARACISLERVFYSHGLMPADGSKRLQ